MGGDDVGELIRWMLVRIKKSEGEGGLDTGPNVAGFGVADCSCFD